MTLPYAERILTFTFELGTGSFGAGTPTKLVFTGHRALAQIEAVNLPSTGMGLFRIYGMTLSHMNQLSRAGLVYKDRGNKVRVEAGDKSGMTAVFYGIIIEAYPDMNEAPNSAFVVVATPTNDVQLKPTKPVTFPGPVSGPTALTQILKNSGLGITLENNGITAQLASPYFAGTTWTQILNAVKSIGCFATLERMNNLLAIWPKTGARQTNSPPLLAPETGMIGYPTFQYTQIRVRTMFDPAIKASGVGKKVRVKSQLEAANGMWSIFKITYNLSSELPGGPWEMLIEASPLQ